MLFYLLFSFICITNRLCREYKVGKNRVAASFPLITVTVHMTETLFLDFPPFDKNSTMQMRVPVWAPVPTTPQTL